VLKSAKSGHADKKFGQGQPDLAKFDIVWPKSSIAIDYISFDEMLCE